MVEVLLQQCCSTKLHGLVTSALRAKEVGELWIRLSLSMHKMIEKIFARRTKLMFDPGLFPHPLNVMLLVVCSGMIQILQISQTSMADSAATRTT
jgi:hypothetical protein